MSIVDWLSVLAFFDFYELSEVYLIGAIIDQGAKWVIIFGWDLPVWVVAGKLTRVMMEDDKWPPETAICHRTPNLSLASHWSMTEYTVTWLAEYEHL